MDRKSVTSSHITSIGHDGNDTLEVEYASGQVYRYTGVAAEDYDAMFDPDNVGRSLRSLIHKSNIVGTVIKPNESPILEQI